MRLRLVRIEFILFVSARRDETYKINEMNEHETLI